MVAGVTAYGFLVLSARALGPERYSPLSVLWALVTVVGPGFFLPLEQEVGRAIASRRARGEGAGTAVRRAVLLGTLIAAVLIATSIAGADLLLSHLFEDDSLLLTGLLLALIGYSASYLVRGTLSGTAQFGTYGALIAIEGMLRLGGCVLLFMMGVHNAGPYGLVLGLAPLLALPVALRGDVSLAGPGTESSWRDVSHALGYLLIASVLAQLLVNSAPLAIKVLSTEQTDAAAGTFLAGLVMARIPLFLFQAIQAALLPKLSGLAGAQQTAEFRSGFSRLLKLVTAIGVVSTAVALAVGPELISFLFGEEFRLGNRDLGYLAGASALFMVALTFSQGLIALSAYRAVALGWLTGVGVFLIATAAGSDLFLRVELGFAGGCMASALTMGVAFTRRLRSWMAQS